MLRLSALAAAAAAVAAAGDITLPSLAGERYLNDVLRSNDLYVVPIVEEDTRCGELCPLVYKALSSVIDNSDGLVKGGVLRPTDSVLTPSGEHATVHHAWNVSTIPRLSLFLPSTGPRSLTGLQFPPQAAAALLTQGPKVLYQNLVALLPNAVEAPLRAGPTLVDFLNKTAPALPRVMLLHKQGQPSALYKRVALEFASRAVFGLAPAADEAVLRAFGVDNATLPALFVSGPGPIDVDGTAAPPAAAPAEADKPKKGKKAAAPAPPSYTPKAGAFAGWTRFSGKDMKLSSLMAWLNATLPPAPVPQLTSPAAFDALCGPTTPGVCILAVLPPAAAEQAAAGAGPLATLQRVASQPHLLADFEGSAIGSAFPATRLAVSFGWVDGEAQAEWAEALRVSTPGLIAWNPRKKVVAPMTASFSADNVAAFVNAVLRPRKRAPGMEKVADPAAEYEAPPVDVVLEKVDKMPELKPQVSRAALAAALGGGKGKGAPAKKPAPAPKKEL